MGIKVGVVSESAPGERRVAMIPGAISVLNKTGVELIMESGAGVPAGFPDSEYAAKGVALMSRAEVFAKADVLLQVRSLGANPDAGADDLALLRRGQAVIGFGEPLTAIDAARATGRTGRHLPGDGTDAAHHARAEHGRALVHGHHCGLQGGADRRRCPAPHVPHADDRGRHRHSGARAGDRRRRGGTAGHRHGAASGRGGQRIRHPRGGERAGGEPGRALRRARRRGDRARKTRAAMPRPWAKISTGGSAKPWAACWRSRTW